MEKKIGRVRGESAIGERRRDMTLNTLELRSHEDVFASNCAGGKRAVTVPERAPWSFIKGTNIRGQVIEVLTASGVFHSEWRVGRLAIVSQSCSTEGIDDIIFKILNLIKVAGPVHRTVARPGFAA